MEDIWLISIAALLVGAAIGFLMGRSGNASNKQAELSEQLESARTELENYKVNVNQHFEKTATLVNELTTSYKDVHEHLASGAQDLCEADTLKLALEPSMQSSIENKEAQSDSSNTSDTANPEASSDAESSEAPRDYAPKKPEDEGTLSETFGLKEDQTEGKEDDAAETLTESQPTIPEEKK